jgi:hypothetical protein
MRTIVYIHGLENKPPPAEKQRWCSQALAEGLKRNTGQARPLDFALAYWADLRYGQPDDPATMAEPYKEVAGEGPFDRYALSVKDAAQDMANKYLGRALDKEKDLIGIGSNVELLLGVALTDLGAYYDDESLRNKIRGRLSDILAQHRGGRVFLIAHSMGSIVAYDVLRKSEPVPGSQIEHFVTIGSPLGLPLVTQKIRKEFGGTQTPAIVRRWTNLADPGDKVALDCRLDDEYTASATGVRVQDVRVYNAYVSPGGKANRHKSYGYLRTPEMSELLRDFLA